MNKMSDYRLKHILHKGDQICADGAVYTITGEPLGFGGTSILYPAISDDSKLEIAIKEAFPGGAARYHRPGGVIRPVDPKDVGALGQLEQYRKQLRKEMELGQTIRNSSIRAIGLWKNLVPSAITVDGKTYTEVSDGIYSILERMDRKGKTFNQLLQYISELPSGDAPLKTGFLPKVHTTALMMEQVLLALQRVHTAGENGFLFGDIQDGNVFFSDCRLEQGDIGIGNLLDFGCARHLVDGNQTEEITDRQVFSTMGFIPPEILDPERNNGTLRLTRAADIYSVGCLMLRCVLSSAFIYSLGASPVVDDEAIDEEAASRLGCTESIRNLLNLILQKALQTEPEDRYSDADSMLADIRKLKQDTAPPTYLLPKAPGSSASFVEGSRDEEIRRIMQALTVNTPAFLWGCGGIGKSEIAIKVAQEFEKISPKGAYFVHYTVPTDEKAEAMEETVLRMPFEGYKYEPEQPGMSLDEQRKADYRKRIGILRKEYAGALLIIDNFDWPGKTWVDLTAEKSYQEIVSLGLNLVFTTRNEVPGTSEVKELSQEDLLKLMRRWCADLRITDEQLLELIDAVDGHTLTVDIIAKTLEESWGDVTPEMMLDAIKSSKLSQVQYPKVTHQPIIKGQDPEQTLHRDPKTAQIYEHLKALFDLTGMTEQDRTVLCCATLLPDGGMDALIFRSCLETKEKEALQKLVKRGWLSQVEGLMRIHPIIRVVCKDEVSSDNEGIIPFLQKLSAHLDQENIDNDTLLQITEMLQSLDFTENTAKYMINASEALMKFSDKLISSGLAHKALPSLLKSFDIEEKMIATCMDQEPDAMWLVRIYLSSTMRIRNSALSLLEIKENDLAVHYWVKSLRMQEKAFFYSHYAFDQNRYAALSKASSINAENTIFLTHDILSFSKKHFPEDLEHIFEVYSALADCYGEGDDFENKKIYQLEMISILKARHSDNIENEEYCDTVIELLEDMYTAAEMCDTPRKQKKMYKQLLMLEKHFKQKSNLIYASYCVIVGEIYIHLKKYGNALKYLLQAEVFYEKDPGKHVLSLTTVYLLFATIYLYQPHLSESLTHLQKGIDNIERYYDPQAPMLHALYATAFIAYITHGKKKKARAIVNKFNDRDEFIAIVSNLYQ